MRFGNARQCIHDAFATHMTTPDRLEAGGTRYNSDSAIAHQAEAGLIIRAVLDQKPYLRGICIFLNAPNGWAKEADIAAMKIRLWADFIRGQEIDPRVQGEMVAIFDRILINYRRLCINPSAGDVYLGVDLADALNRSHESYIATIATHQSRMMHIIARHDNASLQPVWKVVTEQQEKRRGVVVEPINPRTGEPYKDFRKKAEGSECAG